MPTSSSSCSSTSFATPWMRSARPAAASASAGSGAGLVPPTIELWVEDEGPGLVEYRQPLRAVLHHQARRLRDRPRAAAGRSPRRTAAACSSRIAPIAAAARQPAAASAARWRLRADELGAAVRPREGTSNLICGFCENYAARCRRLTQPSTVGARLRRHRLSWIRAVRACRRRSSSPGWSRGSARRLRQPGMSGVLGDTLVSAEPARPRAAAARQRAAFLLISRRPALPRSGTDRAPTANRRAPARALHLVLRKGPAPPRDHRHLLRAGAHHRPACDALRARAQSRHVARRARARQAGADTGLGDQQGRHHRPDQRHAADGADARSA